MAESPTAHFEHAEHAEHVAHAGDAFLTRVSITIAILAVLAASVSSLETIETSGVTVARSEAVLLQNKATDAWNFFQAKSMKRTMYQLGLETTPARRDDYTREAARYKREQDEIEQDAKKHEEAAERKTHQAEQHEHRHHILTGAATLLHISIAIATIAIIMRGRRWPYYGAITLGAAGVATAAFAYLSGGGH